MDSYGRVIKLVHMGLKPFHLFRFMAGTGRLFENRIPIHQIHSLCGCNKHKRVQRCAMTRRKAVSEKH